MTTILAPAAIRVPVDERTPEWHAARRAGVTASEIATILGISSYGSPFNLYYRKRAEISDQADNDAMSLGRHLEPWVADRWAEDHPEFGLGRGGLYANVARPWQLATPDRLVYEFGGVDPLSVLEIKSSATYDGWGPDGSDEIPVDYRAQVLWQLDTLGLPEAHVTCLFLFNQQRRDYVVPYDVADVALMRNAAQEFRARLERGDPPPIDHHPATTAALKELYELSDDDTEATIPATLARRYAAAKAAAKKAEERVKRAENEIRARAGDAKTIYDPAENKVATRSVYEVAEHTRGPYTVDKLTPARPKKG